MMYKLPLMNMPRFTSAHYRPIFSLLKNFNNSSHSHYYCNVHPLSFNRISSIPKPHFISHDFTSFFCTLSSSSNQNIPSSLAAKSVSRRSKRVRHYSPEHVLKKKLDLCTKYNNLEDAIQLYDSARIEGITLSIQHYNSLLYLCALSASSSDSNCNGSSSIDGLEKGFEIYRQMGVDKVEPNEATFTSLARLAAAKEDPEMAFDLVKQMTDSGNSPKVRSYGPALFGFCEKGDAEGAYEVDAHMLECGVVAEEAELCALLRVSVEVGRGDKVYEILHRLRASVRQVSEETARILEGWFASETASVVGVENWDSDKVKEGVIKGGGGWHGQGWLGSGKWTVARAEMDKNGVCSCCGEKLVCIDIDPKETESFASKLSSLACEKEKRAKFLQFQEWLKTHGPFDAVVDGANVSMINSHTFTFRPLIYVVKQLQRISPSKRLPLVILHRSRVNGGPADHPNTKRFLETWRNAGALYATPKGSNDDWYWLYAAVYCKCLLVTNDEMRDHLFQLLGNSIFPRWKEKHQVKMTASRSGFAFHMPPPYSIVIQESERGSWHIPTVTGDDLETPRQWLCATRTTATSSYSGIQVPSLEHNNEVSGESLDLMKYVNSHFEGPPLFPSDLAKQEIADVLFSDVDSFHKTVTSSKEEGVNADTGAAFDYIENALSKFKDGPFFLGQFSLVDIAYAPFFEGYIPILLEVKNYDLTTGRPKIAAWIEEINQIEGYKRTQTDPKLLVESYKKRFVTNP